MSINFRNPGLPGQPIDLVRSQPTVRIYFIATQLMTKREDGTVTSPILSAGGHGAMQMPPIGEYLDVPKNVAEILFQQGETYSREKEKVPGFTTDATLARLVRDSFERNLPLEQIVAEKASVNLPNEQLLALLEKRGFRAVPIEESAVEEEVKVEDSDKTEAPKNKGGRPPAHKDKE